MTLTGLVNASQRWRIMHGAIPSCPVGTIVTLTTSDYRLDVSRPWFGVVAQLDLRTATITASSDGHELTLGTSSGDVAFQNEDAVAATVSAAAANLAVPDVSALVGQVVQFGTTSPNAEGLNMFVILVLRRLNGWALGLTQAGHPAGIAEHNIAWFRVLDGRPRTAPDRLVLTYLGKRKECDQVFQSEVPTLRELGYEAAGQDFLQESRSTATVVLACLLGLLLALVLIGIAIFAWLILTKPPGVLTVTFHRIQA